MNLNDQARFFLIYPMDLEDLGLVELNEKLAPGFTLIKQIPGGLEIDCPLHVGLSLNTILRTPTRILLRIGEFKCRDAPKLFQKISKFNWGPWLIGQTPEVESATINSRLFDSRKIEKALQNGVLQYYRHKPVKKKFLDHLAITDLKNLPKIYFRAVDDVCTLSLDTTGERLHKRGEKILTGMAPIRESLAALLLKELQLHLKNESYTLIDPMCGSGTFLLEALDSNAITTTREFSYSHLAVVINDPTLLIKPMPSTNNSPFQKFKGFELNPEIVKQAKKNCENSKIEITQADFFDKNGHFPIEKPSVVIINPPYGKRIGERGPGENEINLQYYLNIIEAAQKKFAPELLGIIVPSDFKIRPNNSFLIHSARPFKNGGIEVVFYVLGFK